MQCASFDPAVGSARVITGPPEGTALGASEGMGDWEWERIPGASYRRPFWEETADHASFMLPDAPVIMASYDDALAYCTHRGRRLPSEADRDVAKQGVVRDPRGTTGTKRTVRGGSWWCGACTCEGNGLFYRGKFLPSASYNNIGFAARTRRADAEIRCVLR